MIKCQLNSKKHGLFDVYRTILIFALAIIVILPSLIYNTNASAENSVNIWYTSSVQKIRPEVSYEKYSGVKTDNFSVKMGKAEYESAQIIMSALKDVKSYDLKLNDLKLVGNEEVVFPKSNVEVFNQKYITVTTVKEVHPDSTPGRYPDAVVPLNVSKQYGEDKIKAGENGGLWVTFYAAPDQMAGEYKGEFILTVNGQNHTIPASVTVWDYDFALNHTAKSAFLLNWSSMPYCELDSSQNMYDSYVDALSKFRLQTNVLAMDINKAKQDDIDFVAKLAKDYASKPENTVVFMPGYSKFDKLKQDYLLDTELFERYFRAYIKESLDSYDSETGKGVNIIAKTMCYFMFIDEPQMTGLEERAQETMRRFKALKNSLYLEYKQEILDEQSRIDNLASVGVDVTSLIEKLEWKKAVVDAIPNVHNIVTGPKIDKLDEVDVFCPLIDVYDSESNRNTYDSDPERWFYTAVGPRYPYPTYHIDDLNLVSSRLIGWMQADYDVVGNLYWATNLYSAYSWEKFIEDPYETPLRYEGANGDGFLLYPGKKYGIKGPVASIRLHNVRDGVEDYEILEGIENIYKNIGETIDRDIDFNKAYSFIAKELYSGTRVSASQQAFDITREAVANLAILAKSGGAVESIQLKNNQAELKVVLPDSFTITADNKTETDSQNGYKTYTITKKLSGNNNIISFKVINGENQITVSIPVGGEMKTFNPDKIINGLSIRDGNDINVTTPVEEGALVESGSKIRLDLPATGSLINQAVLFTNDTLSTVINKTTKSMIIKIYNSGDVYDYSMHFNYSGISGFREVISGKLERGMNEIKIDGISTYNWEKYKTLKAIRMYFGPKGNAVANSNIHIVSADIYY